MVVLMGEDVVLFVGELAEAIFALVEDEELGDTAAVASAREVAVDDVGGGARIKAHTLCGVFGGLLAYELLPSECDAFDGEGGSKDTSGFIFDLLTEIGVFVCVLVGDKSARVGDKEAEVFLAWELDAREGHLGFGFIGCGSRFRIGAYDGRRAGWCRAWELDGFKGDIEFDGCVCADGDAARTGEVAGSSDSQAIRSDLDLLPVDGGITDQAAIEFNATVGCGIDKDGAFFDDGGWVGPHGRRDLGGVDFGDFCFGFSSFGWRASAPSSASSARGFFGVLAFFGWFCVCGGFFAHVFLGFLDFLVPFADLVAARMFHQEAFEQGEGIIIIFLTVEEFDAGEAGFEFDALLCVFEP